MKQGYTLISLLIAPLIVLLFTAETNRSSGSPGGKTGSPADGENCTVCHTGSASPASNWITTNIPATGYVAGQTYQITATGTNAAAVLFGFEITAEDQNNEKSGTFTVLDAAQTQFTNAQKAITHTSNGTTPTNGSKTWNVGWTAPPASSGEITFYAAFNAANGNGFSTDDKIHLSTTSVSPDVTNTHNPVQSSLTLYPNPSTHWLWIELPAQIENRALTIYTIRGEKVFAGQVARSGSRLNIHHWPTGIYLVKTSNTALKFYKSE